MIISAQSKLGMALQQYPGKELPVFLKAVNWKKYFSNFILPYLKGRVLEVGAGIGASTNFLNCTSVTEWVLLEPDLNFYKILQKKLKEGILAANSIVQNGNIDSVGEGKKFDTILYIDVLEHIYDDNEELRKASTHLTQGGHIIVLSPAFQSLYSSFDESIGHYRRYDKAAISGLKAPSLELISVRYLDSMGFFASWTNKLILKQKYPTEKQILFWDRWLLPISGIVDKLFGHSFGKSVLCIWKKN